MHFELALHGRLAVECHGPGRKGITSCPASTPGSWLLVRMCSPPALRVPLSRIVRGLYTSAVHDALLRKSTEPTSMRHKFTTGLVIVSLLLPLAACSPTVRKPRLRSPGPAWYQRANAEEFDPYPQNDMGPEIVGGRPRGFQKPRSEVERSRQQLPVGPWRAENRY